MRTPDSTLIATLGSEPQVITLALDHLLGRREQIRRVLVLHTSPTTGPVAAALNRLQAEFASGHYLPPLELHTLELHTPQGPLADVDTREGAEAVFAALYRAIRAEKLAGRRVHLSIAGGRKTMAVFGMAAAQMLFDDEDHLWHLISAGGLLVEKRMHAEARDEVHLVEIPVVLWSAISPVLTDLSQVDDPFQAVERQRQLRLQEQLEKARTFIKGNLSEAERPVVELLVREGLSNDEIAERQCLSPRTVERHLGEACHLAADHWEMDNVSRTQLVALLSLYYTLQIGGKPA